MNETEREQSLQCPAATIRRQAKIDRPARLEAALAPQIFWARVLEQKGTKATKKRKKNEVSQYSALATVFLTNLRTLVESLRSLRFLLLEFKSIDF